MVAARSFFYGYLLGKDIQVNVKARALIRVVDLSRTGKQADTFLLGKTSMTLLLYLLEHVGRDVVSYNDILHDVWDRRGLVSSHKRLGQVIKELRCRLKALGVKDNVIVTVRGRGYRVSFPYVVRLYAEPVFRGEGAIPVCI